MLHYEYYITLSFYFVYFCHFGCTESMATEIIVGPFCDANTSAFRDCSLDFPSSSQPRLNSQQQQSAHYETSTCRFPVAEIRRLSSTDPPQPQNSDEDASPTDGLTLDGRADGRISEGRLLSDRRIGSALIELNSEYPDSKDAAIKGSSAQQRQVYYRVTKKKEIERIK